jgi:hypothetical protein
LDEIRPISTVVVYRLGLAQVTEEISCEEFCDLKYPLMCEPIASAFQIK